MAGTNAEPSSTTNCKDTISANSLSASKVGCRNSNANGHTTANTHGYMTNESGNPDADARRDLPG